MKLSTVKRYRKKHKLLGALLMRNPVLVMGMDLPFIIAMATRVKNAAAMTICMMLIHVVTMLVARITRTRLRPELRMLVNVAVATAMMMLGQVLVTFLFRGISNALGMYLYLLAVNGMTIVQSSAIEKKTRIWPVFSGAVLNVLGFGLVAFVVALFREYFGLGTIWGIAVPVPLTMRALMIPFSGFIVVGFLLAFARFVNKQLLAISMKEAARREAGYARIHIDSVETIDL